MEILESGASTREPCGQEALAFRSPSECRLPAWGGLLFLASWLVSRSIGTAAIFSLVPVGFMVPIVLVFVVAAAQVAAGRTGLDEAYRRSDAVVAVCYTASVIPYWFSAISAIRGRLWLSLVLLAACLVMAVLPLRSMLRVRRAIEGGAPGQERRRGSPRIRR